MSGIIVLCVIMWFMSGILTATFVHACGPVYIDGKEFVGILFIWPLFLLKASFRIPVFLVRSVAAAFRIFNGVHG